MEIIRARDVIFDESTSGYYQPGQLPLDLTLSLGEFQQIISTISIPEITPTPAPITMPPLPLESPTPTPHSQEHADHPQPESGDSDSDRH